MISAESMIEYDLMRDEECPQPTEEVVWKSLEDCDHGFEVEARAIDIIWAAMLEARRNPKDDPR